MHRSATLAAALALAALPVPAASDGFALGAGRWSCNEVLHAAQSGSAIEKGQLAGWILGFWTAATFRRETGFVDTVERAGGQAIYDATLKECSKAPPETLLYQVSQHMIRNTQ